MSQELSKCGNLIFHSLDHCSLMNCNSVYRKSNFNRKRNAGSKIFYCRSINFALGEKSNRSLGKSEDSEINSSFYCCSRRISRQILLSRSHFLPFVFDLIIIYDYIEKIFRRQCLRKAKATKQQSKQTKMFYRIRRRRRRWINFRILRCEESKIRRICLTCCRVQWSLES